MSDDKIHDFFLVQHFFTLHWGYLKNQGWFLKQHVVWNGGC
jgi:hypothetical protein